MITFDFLSLITKNFLNYYNLLFQILMPSFDNTVLVFANNQLTIRLHRNTLIFSLYENISVSQFYLLYFTVLGVTLRNISLIAWFSFKWFLTNDITLVLSICLLITQAWVLFCSSKYDSIRNVVWNIIYSSTYNAG